MGGPYVQLMRMQIEEESEEEKEKMKLSGLKRPGFSAKKGRVRTTFRID
jgi:hypothetical protein